MRGGSDGIESTAADCILKWGAKLLSKRNGVRTILGDVQGRRHEVLFGGDGFIGTQTNLPPKFSFSSDFGHFILKMVINAKLSCVKKKDRIYKKKRSTEIS